MADFVDSCISPDVDENITQLPISPEKPANVASPYAILSSVSEAAKNNDEEFKMVHQSHVEVLETSCKLISCGNRSNENINIEQGVSRYQTCNRVIALPGDKNDADYTRSNNMCGMHEDLLFEIMLWLPVASLLRFKSVCRLWFSLIDSSTFITQHHNHNRDKSCLLARHVVSSDCKDYKFFLLSGNKYEVYSNLDYRQPWYSVNQITILNSCDGVVSLLNKTSGNVALWNPATKQLRPLPESSISHSCLFLCNGIGGFGFDVKSKDYKFVKIHHHYQNKHKNLVEVYNLRTDSWRIIHKDDVLPFQRIDCNVTICKNGRCFWTGYAHDDKFSPILISFNLNNEVFETMSLPGERDPDQPYHIHAYNALDHLNDKPCYIKGLNFGPFATGHKYFEIWMLDEYGVKESWKKICKFRPMGSKWDPPYVFGFSMNRQFLLFGTRYGSVCELHLSNIDAREEDCLELQNPKPLPSKLVCYNKLQNPKPLPSELVCYNKLQNPNPMLSGVVCYNESLVSLKREDGAYK